MKNLTAREVAMVAGGADIGICPETYAQWWKWTQASLGYFDKAWSVLCEYENDKGLVINNTTIYGSYWTPDCKNSSWYQTALVCRESLKDCTFLKV